MLPWNAFDPFFSFVLKGVMVASLHFCLDALWGDDVIEQQREGAVGYRGSMMGL